MGKIKKHLDKSGDYHIYETEKGEKGIANNKERLNVGDKIKLEPLTPTHPLFNKIEEDAKKMIFEIGWIFSKI